MKVDARLHVRVGRLLDALLGPRCICGQRVFPRDWQGHVDHEHAGNDMTEARRP